MLFVSTVVVQTGLRARRLSTKLVCLSNLQHIARAFATYGSGLEGFPFATSSDAVRALVEGGMINRERTRSPRTSEELAIRYPSGIPFPFDDRTVVAYEPLTDSLDGACVVFAVGHAVYLPANEYRRTIGTTEEATTPP